VAVNLDNLLDRRRLEQGRRDALLDAEDDALGRGDADGCAAELDGLEGVFDLEEAAFGGEGVDAAVWRVKKAVSKLQEGMEAAGTSWRAGSGCRCSPYSDLAMNILAVLADGVRGSGYVFVLLVGRKG
jgi:hypothetical protein